MEAALVQDGTRFEALSQSVRVSLANGGNETAEAMVARAEVFAGFLTAAS